MRDLLMGLAAGISLLLILAQARQEWHLDRRCAWLTLLTVVPVVGALVLLWWQ